jgi:CO/xanthine dehydrogenase FAD-binding subunit
VVAAVARTPARVVVSDCCGRRGRLTSLERILEGAAPPPREQIEELVRAEFHPSSDLHASAGYKRYIAGVCVADALGEL